MVRVFVAAAVGIVVADVVSDVVVIVVVLVVVLLWSPTRARTTSVKLNVSMLTYPPCRRCAVQLASCSGLRESTHS